MTPYKKHLMLARRYNTLSRNSVGKPGMELVIYLNKGFRHFLVALEGMSEVGLSDGKETEKSIYRSFFNYAKGGN